MQALIFFWETIAIDFDSCLLCLFLLKKVNKANYWFDSLHFKSELDWLFANGYCLRSQNVIWGSNAS